MRKTWPVKWVCPECGGDNVGSDANSNWDTVLQCEELGSTFDDGWCSDCGDVSVIEERLTRAEVAQRRTHLAALPINRLRAALRAAHEALGEAIERLQLNDCEGEERPSIRALRSERAAIRKALKESPAVT